MIKIENKRLYKTTTIYNRRKNEIDMYGRSPINRKGITKSIIVT